MEVGVEGEGDMDESGELVDQFSSSILDEQQRTASGGRQGGREAGSFSGPDWVTAARTEGWVRREGRILRMLHGKSGLARRTAVKLSERVCLLFGSIPRFPDGEEGDSVVPSRQRES